MGCHISSNGLAALLQGLEQSTCADKLRKLDLNDCHIGTEGAKVLGLAIGRDSLKLDISDNASIGCDGVTSLAQGLQTASRTRLISLYMHSIGMGDAGLKSLADAIRCGVLADCLQIDVSGNDFHNIVPLVNALRSVGLKKLTYFATQTDTFGSEAAVLLVFSLMEHCPALEDLLLDEVTSTACKMIEEICGAVMEMTYNSKLR